MFKSLIPNIIETFLVIVNCLLHGHFSNHDDFENFLIAFKI